MDCENDNVLFAYRGDLGPRRQLDVKQRIDWIIEQAQGSNVLDIGCSQGINSLLLGVRGMRVLGIDIDAQNLAIAQNELQTHYQNAVANVRFVHGDFLTYDFDDLRFDTILITEVLEHVDDPLLFLKKAAKLLSESGRMIITVPFGINDYHDHKRTYYLADLYEQIDTYFTLSQVKLLQSWIGVVALQKNGPSYPIDLQSLRYLERGFWTIENTLRTKDKKRLERIARLETQRTNLNERIDELRQSTHAKILALRTENRGVKKSLSQAASRLEDLDKENQLLQQKLHTQSQQYTDLQAKIASLQETGVDPQYNQQLVAQLRERQNKLIEDRMQLRQRVQVLRRQKASSDAKYSELAHSKLGRLQLAYWHSPRFPARAARRVYHGLKAAAICFQGKKQDLRATKQLPVVTQAPGKPSFTSREMQDQRAARARRSLTRIPSSKNAILFMATNGAGLGHLTRSMAIARQIRNLSLDQEILFLTTSVAMSLLNREEFPAYHVPPKTSLNSDITPAQWGALLTDTLDAIFSLHDVKTVVFDGAFPYAQFVRCIRQQDDLAKIWVKRGNEKAGMEATRVEQEKSFDTIILPAEAGKASKPDDARHINVPPIIFIEKSELLSRDQVRKLFHVPDDKLFVYVQLGAGNINDIHSQIGPVIRALRKRGDIVIALGESIIGDEFTVYETDIVIIKDYPNSKYFEGFDFAISACGYNSFHELLYLQLPSLLLPNMETGTDDQYGRAMRAVNAGAALLLDHLDEPSLDAAIAQLADAHSNRAMRTHAEKLNIQNGALHAAQYILSQNVRKGGA